MRYDKKTNEKIIWYATKLPDSDRDCHTNRVKESVEFEWVAADSIEEKEL